VFPPSSGSTREFDALPFSFFSTEAYLKSLAASFKTNARFSFTVIREGFYSESFPTYIGFPNLQNPESKFRIPHDGSGPGIAWAKMDDLGEATAELVRNYYYSGAVGLSEYKNQINILAGLRAYSLGGRCTGCRVRKEGRDGEHWRGGLREGSVVQRNLSPYWEGDVPRKWATSFEAVKRSEAAVTSVRLEELLGRKPENFEATATATIQKLHGM
jgi:hypothetical protein